MASILPRRPPYRDARLWDLQTPCGVWRWVGIVSRWEEQTGRFASWDAPIGPSGRCSVAEGHTGTIGALLFPASGLLSGGSGVRFFSGTVGPEPGLPARLRDHRRGQDMSGKATARSESTRWEVSGRS